MRYSVCQLSGKTDNFDFFGPSLLKKGFWGWNFRNLSPDSRSAPPRYHVCQFSGKMDNFKLFGLNLGKLLDYVGYFGSYNIESVAESWVETEMSWVEVGGRSISWKFHKKLWWRKWWKMFSWSWCSIHRKLL